MIKKRISKIKIFLMLIILLSSFVYAFKVTSLDKQITVQPGETKIVELEIERNNEEIVKAEITEGEEIAKLKETKFLIKTGTKIPIEIKIPKEADEDNYRVTVSFSTETGKVIGTGYSTSFDVVVSPELSNVSISQKRTNYLNWMIVASVITGIIVLLIVLKKRIKNFSLF